MPEKLYYSREEVMKLLPPPSSEKSMQGSSRAKLKKADKEVESFLKKQSTLISERSEREAKHILNLSRQQIAICG